LVFHSSKITPIQVGIEGMQKAGSTKRSDVW